MNTSIEEYDNFIKYAMNVDEIQFSKDFYNGKFDRYVRDKIILLRSNFGMFWCGLDKENKEKYIELVNKYYNK